MIKVKIKEIAEARGITTAYQLQKALGVAPSVAADLWNAGFKQISLTTLNKLCSVLKCQPNKILHHTSEENSQGGEAPR
jgi:DNA-binding Xre family transcriptional regulator